MRIAFVWDWQPNFEQSITWKDGLAAALKELENRGHTVERYTDTLTPIPHEYGTIYRLKDFDSNVDVILHWGDMTRPHAIEHAKLGIPMAICFAGGEALGENVELFDHIFVESEIYRKTFEEAGYSTSIAFGTNTELFKPIPRQKKVVDVIFPATYAKWKRHELLAAATKDYSVVTAGYMYPGTWESDCYEVMQDSGALTLPHVSADVLHHLYAASKVCVVPSMSSGGSQRTVLEAMAMNVPLVVTDSDKFDYCKGWASKCQPNVEDLREAIGVALKGGNPNSRDYVLGLWSEYTYADALEKGLQALL